MTQHEIIIRELKRRWLTPMDALKVAGTMKLATRVGEIRKGMFLCGALRLIPWENEAVSLHRAGYRLIDKWVETSTGKKVKAYRLVKA